MYLKRIELQGFKSFPEKTRLEFNQGITAVVGPNGSGKSNIADAVRWVLGEQSAKSLRGAKMEDIIFAGTANRRQLGFAEVILVIDNTDKKLNLDFNEVSVSRRVYRSGESEYQINGASCRLKDIHEMFMDTGIGKEGYSIIGQGRIEEILSTRSEDRRLLFEEAAGIVKYKNRKHEAEQKLAREAQNLVRVGDIISELELQLEPLREQSEAAKTYLDLRERLKLLQVNVFLVSADKASEELKQLENDISSLAEQLEGEKNKQEGCAAAAAELKHRLESLGEDTKHQSESLNAARVAMESHEGDFKLGMEQIGNITADIERLKAETEAENQKMSDLRERLLLESKHRSDIENSLKEAEGSLRSKQEAFEDVSRRMSEREQRIEQFNLQIRSKMKAVSDAKAEAQKSEGAYERLQEIKSGLNESREANRAKLAENTEQLKNLEKSLNGLEQTTAKTEADLEQFLNEKTTLSEKLNTESEKLQSLQRSLSESESRHRLLAELESGYEGYLKSVKAVLRQRHNAKFKGICGAVAELVEVDEKYETAIEVALGGAAQNIITRTEGDAVTAIEYLKERKEGRATFLPLTAIKPRNLSRRDILSEPGVCGAASELIRYNSAYDNIFSNLLGRVIVVDVIGNAINLARKYDYSYKIVTLEGELLSPGGAMSGGSSPKVMSLFSRGREIKLLKRRIDSLTKDRGELETQVCNLREWLAIIKGRIEGSRKVLQETALERASLTQSLTQTKSALEAIEQAERDFAEKDSELVEGILSLNRQMREKSSEVAEHERLLEELHKNLDEFQNAMLTEKEEKEEGIRELMEAKSRISALEQNYHASAENITRMEGEIAEAQSRLDNYAAGIETRLSRRAEAEEKLSDIRHSIENLKILQNSLESELNRLAELSSKTAGELAAAELSERETMGVISKLNAENIRLEMKKEQTAENNRRLYDEMWEEYAITYQTAMKYERLDLPVAQLIRDERDLKSEIQSLGNVNVGAIEEYKAVKERFEFLSGQRDDIISAEAKLEGVIAELTQLMERQFIEQFKLISDNFTFVFREMFGGGNAYLRLAEDKNVLSAGIDIIAQPPGKNLQSMSLLSGGERALTATALLFGILRMKPSPFCILDEVEAALDDSNVIRYANYLKNYSSDTQFILVTHRKGTMEAADALYGVTMQEQGVSKLVSVKFTE